MRVSKLNISLLICFTLYLGQGPNIEAASRKKKSGTCADAIAPPSEESDWVKYKRPSKLRFFEMSESDPLVLFATDLVIVWTEGFTLKTQQGSSRTIVQAGHLAQKIPLETEKLKKLAYDLLLEYATITGLDPSSGDTYRVSRNLTPVDELMSELKLSLSDSGSPGSPQDHEDQLVELLSKVGPPSDRIILSATMLKKHYYTGRESFTMYAIINRSSGKMAHILVIDFLPGELAI